MARAQIAVALAMAAILLGGGVWLRASLVAEFRRGEAHGRALTSLEGAEAAKAAHSAAARLRAAADREAADLAEAAIHMRERIDDLESQLARAGDGGDAACLDAFVVRALDAIGRRTAATGP